MRRPERKSLSGFLFTALALLAFFAPVGVASGATVPKPTSSIWFAPLSIAAGGSSRLYWASTDAVSCAASGAWSGPLATTRGNILVSPAVTSSYSITCTNSRASATVTGKLIVTGSAAVPTVSLSATPSAITAGGSSTLAWSSTLATACSSGGGWSGARAATGALVVTPATTSTYSLTCSGAGGSTTQSMSVSVAAAGGGGGGAPTASSASTLGPLAVQSYMSGIAVTAGSKFQQPTIWYPTGGSAPYPGVVFIPGYTSDYLNPKAPLDETDVIQWARFLASHGFVVMFINSSAIQAAGPADKATALVQGVAALAVEGSRAGSPIQGMLQAQNIAVMGHSFGGSAALFAANGGTSPGIKAVVALSPVPDSSGPGRYPNDQVPSLVFGGQGDPYYPDFPGQYASIPGTTSKMLAMFLQNSQYSNMHNIARNPLGTHGTDAQVARYGLSFLELYLVGDARYQQFLVTDAQLQSFGYVP